VSSTTQLRAAPGFGRWLLRSSRGSVASSAETTERTYGAETDVAEVFAAKAKTCGPSTDQLAGRDVHPWLILEELHEYSKHDALVVFGKTRLTLSNTGMRISQHDFGLTVWPGDPHARVGEPKAPPP